MGAYLPLIVTAVLLAGVGAALVYAGSTRAGRVLTGAADLGPVPPPVERPDWHAELTERAEGSDR
ncbi:hypothetical protein [Streptomyces hoynatensis]|uniref:Uncharacterized protein n=1 Tax=Streptomyces hoynatensis TaxID=1141874 RepID=A0A3A9YXH7_9ACTN|nr:hypothetical protein [Streptomyces hoynatensis]RKN40761.1 hypothetical protein D7294_16855 [Streptomyces hoynatensis]